MQPEDRDETDLRLVEQDPGLVGEYAVGAGHGADEHPDLLGQRNLIVTDHRQQVERSVSAPPGQERRFDGRIMLGLVEVHPDDRGRARDLIARAEAAPGGSHRADLRGIDDAGHTRWIELTATDRRDDPAVGGLILNCNDIDERKRAEMALVHWATHDDLTGLVNRTGLTERLEGARAGTARVGVQVGIIFLDIDQFRLVNDGLGHDVGDQLLQALAERLVATCSPWETLARFGGDSFAVLCPHDAGTTRTPIRTRAEQLVAAAAGAFRVDSAEIVITVTAGAACSNPGDSAVTLLRDADTALHRAKAQGRGQVAVFQDEERGRASALLDLSTALAGAVRRDELELLYQPIVDIASERLVACEALARWHHPTRGLVGPDEFIPLAERTGLIGPIGTWVLDTALAQLARWDRERPGGARLNMSVNLSAYQLSDVDCAGWVASALNRGGLDGGRLHLELTESSLVENLESGRDTLRDLRGLGVRIAVDDFGTGYSSLSYLKRLPIDMLKIDRSFVAGLGTDPDDTSIVQAIASLARTLDLDLVAEGVETDRQRQVLLDLGCQLGQGFWWCRPVSGDELETWWP